MCAKWMQPFLKNVWLGGTGPNHDLEHDRSTKSMASPWSSTRAIAPVPTSKLCTSNTILGTSEYTSRWIYWDHQQLIIPAAPTVRLIMIGD